MAADKICKISMFSNFNENWYLWLFWSEELIGIDEICIQGHFYEATIFKMPPNKIVKLLIVSDINENWYLGVFWSEELVGALNSDMRVVWILLCLHLNTIKPSYYYSSSSSSPKPIFPTNFSETDDPMFTKLQRKVDLHLRRCIQVLEFSKWPPLPWKPWTYVKIFDLPYIGSC
jgi:hypothetical protein